MFSFCPRTPYPQRASTTSVTLTSPRSPSPKQALVDDVNAEEPETQPTPLRADGVRSAFSPTGRTRIAVAAWTRTWRQPIYLEIARQTGAPLTTLSVFKSRAGSLVDAGEDCDPEAPGSNASRCRRDCRKRRMLTLAGTTGCAAVNGGVKCWGSNAGLIMGRTIDSRRTCEKIGSDPWYGENTFNVDVAPFVVDVVNPTARVLDLSGGWNEAVCALYGSDGRTYCWGRQIPEETRAALRTNVATTGAPQSVPG